MKKLLQFPTQHNGQVIDRLVVNKRHNPLNIPVRATATERAIVIASEIESHDEDIVRSVRKLLKQVTLSDNPAATAQAALTLLKDSRKESLKQAREIARFEREEGRQRARTNLIELPVRNRIQQAN